ncbi:unnamed protein product [Blepharisma stoltei]|uniref:Uncharacterized protein n=1 Tax=Blepharisma stoltei TaxID=1481888 RepID=A0AAU9JP31_9CILI|nr:unnamed protein product [Blepharisma stoltei]
MVNLNYVETLNQKVEADCSDLFLVLQSEFIQLKFKAARCARKCFIEKLMPESFRCEKGCMEGISNVKQLIEKKQKEAQDNFHRCVERTGRMSEGLDEGEDIMDIETGVTNCYEKFRVNIKRMKGEMITEFSYYQ